MPETNDQFNTSVRTLVTSLVNPTLEAGGDGPDILVKLQSVIVGTIMFLNGEPEDMMKALTKGVLDHHKAASESMRRSAN